jgi:ferredoxin
MVAVTFGPGCTGCGACLLTCPAHAIRPSGGQLYALEGLCTGCGECVEVCPADAVSIPSKPSRTGFFDLLWTYPVGREGPGT